MLMRITNEILRSFVLCQYKAYRFLKSDERTATEYDELFTKLKQKQIYDYEILQAGSNKLKDKNTTIDNITPKGISINIQVILDDFDIVFDALEFIKAKTVIPILIIPGEKVSIADKLFLSLQASCLQAQYKTEYCKIVYGKGFKHARFRLATFVKQVKKVNAEIDKLFSNFNAPNISKIAHCSICEFQVECIQKLKDRDDLSLLSGLKPREIINYNNRGIFSVKQLSYKYKPKKTPYRKRNYLPELKALAIRENKTFIRELPTLKTTETEIYLDIEGLPERNFTYLLGVVIKKGDLINTYSFWADNEMDENEIYIKLIELLKPLTDYTVYHYGSYETDALKKISKNIKQEYCDDLVCIIRNSCNLLNLFTTNIYPPTYSNGLKEIARLLGFNWSEHNASGIQSIIWRYQWELTNDEEVKRKLITYNLEDCKALFRVKEWIVGIPNRYDTDNIVNAESIKIDNIYKWQKNDFLIKAFEIINRFAYFDYQREKVYIKTYPILKSRYKASVSRKDAAYSKLKPNRSIEIPLPRNCENCNAKKPSKHEKTHKIIIDLYITKTGIRKIITQYKTYRYKCRICGKAFTPKSFVNIPTKFGRSLRCWVINQIIFYRISYQKVAALLKETFGINVHKNTVQIFKTGFADYYTCACTEILENIKCGLLIHVDETKYNLLRENGYVWVFTNMNCVYYLYKSSRESDFLKVLLNDFKGVLVSDFYAGYDAIDCPKQRCLIHLIRDINDDMINNQLNEELKSLAQDFSVLLNDIMVTVNKVGLKKRYLHKHKKAVETFFIKLKENVCETEICAKWQKRFLANKDELFTFLDYDGIPWNNNNAEVAVKAVAIFRRDVEGQLTMKRIQEYLTLLSIQQTCKYMGISFLKYLLSGEKSIFKYCDNLKRRKQRGFLQEANCHE